MYLQEVEKLLTCYIFCICASFKDAWQIVTMFAWIVFCQQVCSYKNLNTIPYQKRKKKENQHQFASTKTEKRSTQYTKILSEERNEYSTILLPALSLLEGISDWRHAIESASAKRSPSVVTARSLPSEVLLTLLILLAVPLHLFFFLLSLRKLEFTPSPREDPRKELLTEHTNSSRRNHRQNRGYNQNILKETKEMSYRTAFSTISWVDDQWEK